MPDYQQIVEEIQGALAASTAIDWDLLRDCAAEYSASCEEVNTRLNQCADLLRRGLRSEAIQIAERAPPLLDCVAQLDFPELDQWQELLRANGMTLPLPLRLEIAADLNAAYAEEAPLLSLLKSHRLLALARARLPARINVLRAIRAADPGNPVWGDDLRTYELHRHVEIRRDSQEALKREDSVAIEQLEAEMEAAGWSVPPPAELRAYVQQGRRQLVAQRVRVDLKAIEQQLSQAYADFDAAAAREARDRWMRIVHLALLNPDDELLVRAQPALDWIARQDEQEQRSQDFAAAIYDLEAALDDNAGRHILERLMHAVQRFGEEVPMALVQRFNERIRYLDAQVKRRFALRVMTVLGIMFMIAGGITWLYLEMEENRKIVAAIKVLNALLQEKRTEDFSQQLKQITSASPGITADPRIQKLVADANKMEQDEKDRQARFAAAMERLTKSGEAAFSVQDLTTAQEVASLPAEKERVSDFEAAVANHRRIKKEEKENAFRKGMEALAKSIAEIESAEATSDSQAESLYRAAESELRKLGVGKDVVSADAAAGFEPLQVRMQNIAVRLEERRKQNIALDDLTRSVGDVALFRRKLQEFASTFPKSALSRDFGEVSPESTLWEAVDGWRAFYGQRVFSELRMLSPETARRLSESATKLEASHAVPVLREAWQQRAPFVEVIAGRGDLKLVDLKSLLGDRLMKEVYCIRSLAGEMYYTEKAMPDDAFRDGLPHSIRYYSDFSFTVKKRDLRQDDFGSAGPAPQISLGKQLRKSLTTVESGKWETGFLEMLRTILEDKSETDPVLRLVLLRKTVDIAGKGSHPLRVACEELQKELDEQRADLSANWLDPVDAESKAARNRAQEFLSRRSGSAAGITERALEVFRKCIAEPGDLPTWHGWLHRHNDQLMVRSLEKSPSDGRLVVLMPETGMNARWVEVGRVKKSQVEMSRNVPGGASLSGRPVYLQIDLPLGGDENAKQAAR